MTVKNCEYFIKVDNSIYVNLCMWYLWRSGDENSVNVDFYSMVESAVEQLITRWHDEIQECKFYIDIGDMDYKSKLDPIEGAISKIINKLCKSAVKPNIIYKIYKNEKNEKVAEKIDLKGGAVYEKNTNIIMEVIGKIIKNFFEYTLKEHAVKITGKNIYLESANVFANEYVLVKNLFMDSVVIDFYIYNLYLKIKYFIIHNNLNQEQVTLISASDTGAMIITALMVLFNRVSLTDEKCNVFGQHLLHIGPRFNYRMNGLPLHELEGNKYIYVFDFMCEGSEYNLINHCIEMGKAQLIGAYGIAKFNYPRHFDIDKSNTKPCFITKDIDFLIDIEKWDKRDSKAYEIIYEGETA